MGIKCSVQERPSKMIGTVYGFHGSDDNHQLVYIELTDIDGSTLEGSFILPPNSKASVLKDQPQEWDVILEALSSPFGDVDTCVTMIKVNDEFCGLHARG